MELPFEPIKKVASAYLCQAFFWVSDAFVHSFVIDRTRLPLFWTSIIMSTSCFQLVSL